jgi:hypothetical protein
MVKDPTSMLSGSTYRSVLERTLARLEDQERWTQGTFARDANGRSVAPVDSSAVCWCLFGGLSRECNEFGFIPPPLMRFLGDMLVWIFSDKFATVGEMNDYVDHPTVVSFLRECLARFET